MIREAPTDMKFCGGAGTDFCHCLTSCPIRSLSGGRRKLNTRLWLAPLASDTTQDNKVKSTPPKLVAVRCRRSGLCLIRDAQDGNAATSASQCVGTTTLCIEVASWCSVP
jgi:hypothetical protein